jgi:hypothetical protein
VSVVALVAGTFWLTRTPPAPPAHAPLSVLIADVQNNTGDAALDRAIEPALKMTLEGASFVTAFDRTQFRNLGLPVPASLDEPSAREVAIKQGLAVVVSGALQRAGNGYTLSLKAAQAVTGGVVGTAEARASGSGDLLAAAARAAGISPRRQYIPVSPTGAKATGIASFWSKSVADRSISPASFNTRWRRARSCRSVTLRFSVRSS